MVNTRKPRSSHFLMGTSILFSELISSHWISAFLYEKAAFCLRNLQMPSVCHWNYQDHEMICSFPLPLEAIRSAHLALPSISV